MKKLKKGFTLVELVIVIAVIAILAAVLIPTFAGLVRKANISRDISNARNMNTVLHAKKYVQNPPADMGEVCDIILSGEDGLGLSIANLSPSTDGYRYVWEKSSNQIILYTDKWEIEPQQQDGLNAFGDEPEFWTTLKNAEEFKSANASLAECDSNIALNYYMVNDITETLTISKITSFDTGDCTMKAKLTVATGNAQGEMSLKGNFEGDVEINAPKATINHSGVAGNVNVVAVADHTYNAKALQVKELKIAKGNITIDGNSTVKTLDVSPVADTGTDVNRVTIENKGIVVELKGDTVDTDKQFISNKISITNENGVIRNNKYIVTGESKTATSFNDLGLTNATTKTQTISNLEQLLAFRDAVNEFDSYKGIKVELSDEIEYIDLKPVEDWIPIGKTNGFEGTFDGKNKIIKNLTMTTADSKKGFNYKAATLSNRDKQRYSHGFFGGVIGGKVENITFEDVKIKLTSDKVANEYTYVGVVAGYLQDTYIATTSGENPTTTTYNSDDRVIATIENITVKSGIIDSVGRIGGIVGWMDSGLIKGCTNKIDINTKYYSAQKVAYADSSGIVAWIRDSDKNEVAANAANDVTRIAKIENCTNDGNLSTNGQFIGGIVCRPVSEHVDITLINCRNNNKEISFADDTQSTDLHIGFIYGQRSEEGAFETISCAVGENAKIDYPESFDSRIHSKNTKYASGITGVADSPNFIPPAWDTTNA